MNKLGKVTQYNKATQRARVSFLEGTGVVSAELPVGFMDMQDIVFSGDYEISIQDTGGTVSGPAAVSGPCELTAVPKLEINDVVLVAFHGRNLSDGVVVCKIGGSA